MPGKRGLGIFHFGFKKPRQGDDDFDIYQLKETIKELKKDVEASNKWIADYDHQIRKWAKYPKVVEGYRKMQALERITRDKTLETVQYYEEELAEEEAKP